MTANVIESIGTLKALKEYCCPRVAHVKEWYLRCVDCGQRKDCTVGRRAVELLNRDTKPVVKTVPAQAPKPVKNVPKFHRKTSAYNQSQKDEARRNAEDVFSKDNPLKYYMAKSGKDRATCMKRISKWMANYPDLVEAYGMYEKYDRVKGKAGRKPDRQKKEEPVMNNPVTDDEMSVEEFLREQETSITDTHADSKTVDLRPKNPPVIFTTEGPQHENPDEILYRSMRKKREAIQERIKMLEKEISECQDNLVTLNKALDIMVKQF